MFLMTDSQPRFRLLAHPQEYMIQLSFISKLPKSICTLQTRERMIPAHLEYFLFFITNIQRAFTTAIAESRNNILRVF